jgi:hypothetical protein
MAARAGSRIGGPGCGGVVRWRPWLAPSLERLDDDHMAAAARARRPCIDRLLPDIVIGRRSDRHQLAGEREMGPAGGAGEQAIMPDAVEPAW